MKSAIVMTFMISMFLLSNRKIATSRSIQVSHQIQYFENITYRGSWCNLEDNSDTGLFYLEIHLERGETNKYKIEMRYYHGQWHDDTEYYLKSSVFPLESKASEISLNETTLYIQINGIWVEHKGAIEIFLPESGKEISGSVCTPTRRPCFQILGLGLPSRPAAESQALLPVHSLPVLFANHHRGGEALPALPRQLDLRRKKLPADPRPHGGLRTRPGALGPALCLPQQLWIRLHLHGLLLELRHLQLPAQQTDPYRVPLAELKSHHLRLPHQFTNRGELSNTLLLVVSDSHHHGKRTAGVQGSHTAAPAPGVCAADHHEQRERVQGQFLAVGGCRVCAEQERDCVVSVWVSREFYEV